MQKYEATNIDTRKLIFNFNLLYFNTSLYPSSANLFFPPRPLPLQNITPPPYTTFHPAYTAPSSLPHSPL